MQFIIRAENLLTHPMVSPLSIGDIQLPISRKYKTGTKIIA